jgi:hypothetical protein
MLRLSRRVGGVRNPHTNRHHHATPTVTAEDSRLTTLKLRIRAASQTGTKSELLALRSSALYRECYEWGRRQAINASTTVGGSQLNSARNAAAVHTICYALDAYAGFIERYDASPITITARSKSTSAELEQAFLSQIHTDHRRNLIEQFHATFQANDDERRGALVSVLNPELRAKLSASGVIHSSGSSSITEPGRAAGGFDANKYGINEAELLALLDYLSSATGTFNVVNGAAMAKAYYGEPVLQSCVNVFSTALASGIDKLCEHPWFGRRDIVVYKGIRLTTLDEPFRMAMLKEAHERNGLVSFPSVLSASCDPNNSYARTKLSEGYSIECVITMRRGFYADPFHDTRTMGEHEILGPAQQRFRIVGKDAIVIGNPESGSDVEIERYKLSPAD